MDNWATYIAIALVGFSAGVIGTAYDHQDEMALLEVLRTEVDVRRDVDAKMKDAGAHRWCELVLAGEIIPTETE